MQATLLPPRNPALCAPITSNRELGSCPIANIPLKDLLTADLRQAGLQIVEPAEAGEHTLRIPIDNWLDISALMMLGSNQLSARLIDNGGNTLAWKGAERPENCLDRIITEANCFAVLYPWDLLRMNEEALALMDETSLLGEVSPLASLSGCVRLAKGSHILPGTVIEGPVIIGPNSRIGPNAYIRGATSIGADCFVGNGAEIKNSIIYNSTYISRQCYVGDSIIGTRVTLGAGTCTENHRHDGRFHTSMIDGKPVNTGRLKFGAVLGDGVCTGVNTSIEAGVKIGISRTTQAGSYIGRDLL